MEERFIFINNYYSPKAGAVFLKCNDYLCLNNSYEIRSCTFIENKYNEIGGAIYCENANLILNSNIFVNNSATQAGGVIYYNGTFKLTLLNNSFINNSAWEGGAIKYTSNPPIIGKDNIFFNNIAFYGPNFASYPIRFSMVEYLYQSNESQIKLNAKPSNIEPVFKNFSLNLIDILNETVMTINNSFISIYLTSNFSSSFGLKGEGISKLSPKINRNWNEEVCLSHLNYLIL